MYFKIIYLWIIIGLSSCYKLAAQTPEIACAEKFNADVYNTLFQLDKCKNDTCSTKFIFELTINKFGKIKTLHLKKGNLKNMGIDESLFISKLKSKKYPCLWDVYYKDVLVPPDKLVIVYTYKIGNKNG